MVATVAFNPLQTTFAAGTFGVTSDGYMQGMAMDDPATRFTLAGGIVANTETAPMFGGLAIEELIPVPGAYQRPVARAVSIGTMTGFSVFNQSHAMISTPQSGVPMSGSGMDVFFHRLGSGARIQVACDPALISLGGSIITSQVSWDFGAQQLAPYTPAYAADTVTAESYAGGLATLTTTSPHGLIVGSDVTLSGFVNSGQTLNGTFTAQAGTTGSTLVIPLAAAYGTVTTQGTLVAGGGLLPVRVLGVQAGNCMTVVYNSLTGFANWNRNGSGALILI